MENYLLASHGTITEGVVEIKGISSMKKMFFTKHGWRGPAHHSRTSIHNALIENLLLFESIILQGILGLLCKHCVGIDLNAHKTQYVDGGDETDKTACVMCWWPEACLEAQ